MEVYLTPHTRLKQTELLQQPETLVRNVVQTMRLLVSSLAAVSMDLYFTA